MKTSIFRNNRTQAVRIPKALAFPENTTEVEIVAVGQARVITPGGSSWLQFFGDTRATDDFMVDRDQPPQPERGDL